MDDFRVKYFSEDDANHLLNPLKKNYASSTDWEGQNYLRLTIDWKYSKEYIDMLMLDYVRKALDSLQHHNPKIPQYAPHRWSVPTYGKILQMAPDRDERNILDNNSTKIVQSILGTMFYYKRSLDPTMLWERNKILRVQSRPTRDTAEKERILLDYAIT